MFDKMIDSLLGQVAIITVPKYNLHTKITNKLSEMQVFSC